MLDATRAVLFAHRQNRAVRLAFRIGIGMIRERTLLAEIVAVNPARNFWRHGRRIHRTCTSGCTMRRIGKRWRSPRPRAGARDWAPTSRNG